MKRINQIKDIEYNGEKTTIEGSIIEIIKEGNPDKKLPTAFKLKLEGSGENLIAVSWQTEHILPILKDALSTLDLFSFECIPSIYKEKEQIKVLLVNPIPGKSVRKIIGGNFDLNSVKGEINQLINENVRSEAIKMILRTLVVENEKFFRTPGGTKIHHSYQGGLAAHSLGVAKKALESGETIKNADKGVIVAGALLHDLGKIEEYRENGERTISGDLFGHVYMGAKKFYMETLKYMSTAADEEKTKFKMIEHVILSHHGKLEFGSPVVPGTVEAVIVSDADESDAKLDSVAQVLRNMEPGEQSERLITTSGKIFKWRG